MVASACPRRTIGLPATSPVIYDAVRMYTVFPSCSTKGHRVVLDASIFPCVLTSKKEVQQSASIYLPRPNMMLKWLILCF